MRRQTRPFVVEVKHRRGPAKKHSVWGDVNIAAVAAETMRDLEQDKSFARSLIDSGRQPIDAANSVNQPMEHNMPDPQESETAEAVSEAPAGAEAVELKKKAPRAKKANTTSKRRAAKEATKPLDAQPTPTRGKRKIYSKKERAQMLVQIEKSIGRGSSIKAAVGEAGISEQTYYHWKRASESVAVSDDLRDLVALEEENKRLKKQLAERLRQENAELRKKLGLR